MKKKNAKAVVLWQMAFLFLSFLWCFCWVVYPDNINYSSIHYETLSTNTQLYDHLKNVGWFKKISGIAFILAIPKTKLRPFALILFAIIALGLNQSPSAIIVVILMVINLFLGHSLYTEGKALWNTLLKSKKTTRPSTNS